MTVRVTWQDTNYPSLDPWTNQCSLQHLQPWLHHCSKLIACDRWQRTREDKERWGQTASPQSCWSQHKVFLKYYASTLTESKEGDKGAKSGRMDYLSWWMCWLLQTARNSSGFGSLSLHQAAQALPSSCALVSWGHTQPLPRAGLTHSLRLMHLATLTTKCYPRWKGSRNISWGIQAGPGVEVDSH